MKSCKSQCLFLPEAVLFSNVNNEIGWIYSEVWAARLVAEVATSAQILVAKWKI